jgi:SAM-dependent methyltransferase
MPAGTRPVIGCSRASSTASSPAMRSAARPSSRRELLAGAAGRVVEVGAGNGLNFPHYSASVQLLVAVEPKPYVSKRAAEAARAAPVPIRVVAASADRLPVPVGSVAAVMVSGVLCSVPDAALAESGGFPAPVASCASTSTCARPAGCAASNGPATTASSDRRSGWPRRSAASWSA